MIGELLKRLRFFRYFIFKIFYRTNFKNKLLQYRFSARCDSVVIVCNGPSLNKVELEKIKYPSIGMNKINLIFEKTNWRPDYVISTNGLVISQNKEFFENYDKPVFLDFKSLFVGVKGKNINYFLSHYSRKFSENFERKVGSAGTVTFSAIQLAYFLGFKNIFIVGMDHNYQGHSNKKSVSKKSCLFT